MCESSSAFAPSVPAPIPAGIKKKVTPNEKIDTPAQIIITAAFPSTADAGSNTIDPNKAPAFPQAAQIPFIVERQPGLKVIEGNINVVVFGPKLEKKNVEAYTNKSKFFISDNLSKVAPIIK
mmetsp:Transcript_5974/g.12509  ORF Transcript_5974/g.12509 Transcript_5974/m.12509 type:complete len:122 (+) Transcript_5974:146-511(+)